MRKSPLIKSGGASATARTATKMSGKGTTKTQTSTKSDDKNRKVGLNSK